MKVWCLDAQERCEGEAMGAQDLGVQLGLDSFRRVTWREGTCSDRSSRFCFHRVKVAQDDGIDAALREPV
jgi:hypothetical protein